jgi:hypothetical protein
LVPQADSFNGEPNGNIPQQGSSGGARLQNSQGRLARWLPTGARSGWGAVPPPFQFTCAVAPPPVQRAGKGATLPGSPQQLANFAGSGGSLSSCDGAMPRIGAGPGAPCIIRQWGQALPFLAFNSEFGNIDLVAYNSTLAPAMIVVAGPQEGETEHGYQGKEVEGEGETRHKVAAKVAKMEAQAEVGYAGLHKTGSRKGTIHQLWDTQGAEVAWTRGIKMGLAEGTLRSWFGFWQHQSGKQPAKTSKSKSAKAKADGATAPAAAATDPQPAEATAA